MAKKKSSPTASPEPAGKLSAAQLAGSAPAPEAPAPVAAPPEVISSGDPVSLAMSKDDKRRVYSPVAGHASEHGMVSMNNWIGHVDGVHRTVDRLTPVSTIPKSVVAAMLSDGMGFDRIAARPLPGAVNPPKGKATVVKNLGPVGIRTR